MWFLKRVVKRLVPYLRTVSVSHLAMQSVAHDELTSIAPDVSISLIDFVDTLQSSDSYHAGSPGRQEYIDGSIQRLYRIFSFLYSLRTQLEGPTLDVASGWGIMYPLFKKYLPIVLPYAIAELGGWEITIDGDRLDGCKFECEKDILNFPDQSFGLVCFFDCIEHLIVDPLWPLLEFNRVLKPGGKIAISTPNAAAAYKIFQVLRGENAASEAYIKPSAIYQRHNREWTPLELKQALACCGFSKFSYSTNPQILSQYELKILTHLQARGLVEKPLQFYGPETFFIAEKTEHITLDSALLKERRWPAWLYTSDDAYRKRPKEFPINISDDYA